MSLTERMAPPRCEKGVLPTVRCHKRPGEVCCRFLGAGQAGSGFAGASDNISFLLLWVWEEYNMWIGFMPHTGFVPHMQSLNKLVTTFFNILQMEPT